MKSEEHSENNTRARVARGRARALCARTMTRQGRSPWRQWGRALRVNPLIIHYPHDTAQSPPEYRLFRGGRYTEDSPGDTGGSHREYPDDEYHDTIMITS